MLTLKLDLKDRIKRYKNCATPPHIRIISTVVDCLKDVRKSGVMDEELKILVTEANQLIDRWISQLQKGVNPLERS